MSREDTFELITSDNPDMLLIAAITADIRALRLSATEHLNQCQAAQNRARMALNDGDSESYRFWVRESLKEDSCFRLVVDTLQQYNIVDKECEYISKATKR